MASNPEHWQAVYETKDSQQVSWYQPHLTRSLALIERAALTPNARIVDIGGGASTLVDDLLERGFTSLAVVDLSRRALEVSQERLGERAESVVWLTGDMTSPLLEPASIDFWHDRAVFHFLVDDASRQRYIDQVKRCVKPGGYVMLATFAEDGPEQCSGLPTRRYSVDALAELFEGCFVTVDAAQERHRTPWGGVQSFVYTLLWRAV